MSEVASKLEGQMVQEKVIDELAFAQRPRFQPRSHLHLGIMLTSILEELYIIFIQISSIIMQLRCTLYKCVSAHHGKQQEPQG